MAASVIWTLLNVKGIVFNAQGDSSVIIFQTHLWSAVNAFYY